MLSYTTRGESEYNISFCLFFLQSGLLYEDDDDIDDDDDNNYNNQ